MSTYTQETTLSGKSIVNNIKSAKEKGFLVTMNYIGVESSQVAKERVRLRVSKGGHGIPDKDIERRYSESLNNLLNVTELCDEINIYDNTDIFKLVISISNGKIIWFDKNLPNWTRIITNLEVVIE